MTEEKPQEDNPYSPTFCVYPWMEMIIGPDHRTRLCCIASKDLKSPKGHNYNVVEYTLEEIWNSDAIRIVREQMLKGEKIKDCSHCYYQESVGKESYRQSFNKQWLSQFSEEIHRRIENSKKENFYVDSPPLYLDIRPGNKCNLKCRMCNPGNSSQIFMEQEELLEKKKLHSGLIETGYFEKNEKAFREWYKNSNLWKNIDRWIPHIKTFYFTGGEPTLIEKNWQIINSAIEGGFSQNMNLVFNINCTYVPDKLLRTFNHFSYVTLSLSIDGFGVVQEYIRHPSKWETIERNIRKILKAKTKNVSIFFSPVIQIYNILRLIEFLEWIDNLSLEFETEIYLSLIICTRPKFFDIATLPRGSVREAALDDIRKYTQSIRTRNPFFFYNELKSIEYILEKKFLNDIQHNGKNFFEYTRVLDEHRGNDFFKSLPRLGKLLKEDHGHISNTVKFFNACKDKINGVLKNNEYI